MWRFVKLTGRDRLLKREIHKRLTGKKPFLLSGVHGSGKTAILEWAFDKADGLKALSSATFQVRETLMLICEGWRLEVTDDDGKVKGKSRWQVAWMEKAIFRQASEKQLLFLDDIEKATPALMRRLKPMRERFVIVCAGTPPFRREELKRLLWGLPNIEVPPLGKEDSLKLAKRLIEHEGALHSAHDIASHSRGLPGRMVAMLLGEVEKDSPRVQGEEIDLAPALLLCLGALMAVRYLGMAWEAPDIFLIGGVGVGVSAFARFVLYRGISR